MIRYFEQSNENVFGGSEDTGVDNGNSRSAVAADWKRRGIGVVNKDVNITTVTV